MPEPSEKRVAAKVLRWLLPGKRDVWLVTLVPLWVAFDYLDGTPRALAVGACMGVAVALGRAFA